MAFAISSVPPQSKLLTGTHPNEESELGSSRSRPTGHGDSGVIGDVSTRESTELRSGERDGLVEVREGSTRLDSLVVNGAEEKEFKDTLHDVRSVGAMATATRGNINDAAAASEA